MTRKYKISFCVVSMNRLHQLKETFIKNLKDNERYDKLEFILLDYNSNDGLEDWVKNNISEYILNGKVIYYRTTQPSSWSPSHSKNLAFKLATGDILCSIWADYYTGPDFANYVNEQFNRNNQIVLTPIDFYKTKENYHPPGDVLGKVCVKKSDFIRIRGFDERMNKHGFEDYDFINRLEMTGVKRVLIDDFAFLKYISHSNDERYLLPIDNLQGFYIHYKSHDLSEALFLYKDGKAKKGVLVDNFTKYASNWEYAYQPLISHFEYGMDELGWITGVWQQTDNKQITIFFDDDKQQHLIERTKNKRQLLVDEKADLCFYYIDDRKLVNDVLTFNHYYDTRTIMEKNLKDKIFAVNHNAFGHATVYKNLKDEPIVIR